MVPRRVKKMVGWPKMRSLKSSKRSCRKLSGFLGSLFLTTSSGPAGFPLVNIGGGRFFLCPPFTEIEKTSRNYGIYTTG